MVRRTYLRWRRDLDTLAGNLDDEISHQLGRHFGRAGPWCGTEMAGTKTLKPGDKVAVPWGLDEIVGTVVEIYGPPARRSVMVRVPIHGPSGETLEESDISFPERALRVVAAA